MKLADIFTLQWFTALGIVLVFGLFLWFCKIRYSKEQKEAKQKEEFVLDEYQEEAKQ